jgi:hypothetical protein
MGEHKFKTNEQKNTEPESVLDSGKTSSSPSDQTADKTTPLPDSTDTTPQPGILESEATPEQQKAEEQAYMKVDEVRALLTQQINFMLEAMRETLVEYKAGDLLMIEKCCRDTLVKFSLKQR